MQQETLAIASDHAGYAMKRELIAYLHEAGFRIQDFGTYDDDAMDYPDTIYPCARAVGKGDFARGIVICGSGIGASIVANKAPGVRAALVLLPEHAFLARRHNDANVLALSGRQRSVDTNLSFLQTWLSTPFAGGRHRRRVEKITQLERNNV